MKFDDLSAEAQEIAIDAIRSRFAGLWWESDDNDAISNTIIYAFASALGAPHTDTYGEGDFPGIVNVELESWNVDGGNGYMNLSGWLTRENAPKLPWVDSIDNVVLTTGRNGTQIDAESHWSNNAPEATKAEIEAVNDAVRDAVNEALSAGRAEYEYKTGAEVAREYCETNPFLDFKDDGTIIDD